MKIEVWAPNADTVSVVTFDGPSEQGHGLDADGAGRWIGDVPMEAGAEYLFELEKDGASWRRLDPRARAATNSVGLSIATEIVEFDRHGFEPPPVNEWVVYELHTGTFGGDLRGVIDRLDHVTALGANVIELLPLGEFAGDVSWGYNPALPFAIESSYGGPAALRELVTAAHERGVAVIVDVVYNHFGPSDLDLWRFDGWSEGDGGGIYFYNDDRADTPWGATRPDYGRPEVREYLIDNARMWFGEYGVDGLRLDSTVNIRNAAGTADPAHDLPEGIQFLQELNDTIHAEYPYAVMVAEDLQNDERVTAPVSEGGLGFDLQWAANFVHPVRAALEAPDDDHRDLDAVAEALVEGGSRRIVYTESHDEVANGRTRVPAEIDPDDPRSIYALRRSALGGALTMASLGVPMVFQGQEWADPDWFDDQRPLDWARLEQRSGIFDLWRDLVTLRTTDHRTGGLRGDQIDVTIDGDVIVVRRWGLGGPESATIVATNLAAADREHVPLNVGDEWQVVFASDWSGYDPSGSDHASCVRDGGCAVAGYGVVILAPPQE